MTSVLGWRRVCGLIFPWLATPPLVPPARGAKRAAAAFAGCSFSLSSLFSSGLDGGAIPNPNPVLTASPHRAGTRAPFLQSPPFPGSRRGRSRSAARRLPIFRARSGDSLKRRWPWRAAEFHPVRLTPRWARKRGRRFRFFRASKTCPGPGCWTPTPGRGL